MFLEDGKKSTCYGCTTCINLCPTNAITMESDKEGFIYPIIDLEKCINCNKCVEACPIKVNKSQYEQSFYGIKAKDLEEKKKSQSGGAAALMTNYIIANGGIVYGAIIGEDLKVYHERISKEEDKHKLKGSKYVQSTLNDTFVKVKKDLQASKEVLFVGTPCQIAGLREYLKNANTDKLYLCDLICHGVPSPKIYMDYINYIENIQKEKILEFDFRDKSFGWQTSKETMKFKNKQITATEYINLFLSNVALRLSCYECRFAILDRTSDITIGDFWGIDKVDPEFLDDTGVSLVIINNKKGEEIFSKIKEKVNYKKYEKEECLQTNLRQPSKKPLNREQFWEDYENEKFSYIIEKYAKLK